MEVAVVGSGVAGLAAAHKLAQSGFRVTLLEADSHVGGHAHTMAVDGVPVDVGFMVFNGVTYPNMIEWFDQLGVSIERSNMSFSVSLKDGCEWGSEGLSALFAKRTSVADPRFARMLYEIFTFQTDVLKFLETFPAEDDAYAGKLPESFKSENLRSFVQSRGYSDFFVQNYLVPICSSIWSTPGEAILDASAAAVLRFLKNHHMLQVFDRPPWMTVKGRSETYVAKVVAEIERLGGKVLTNTRVERVTRGAAGGKVEVSLAGGKPAVLADRCVLAVHAPDALKLLGAGASSREREVLGAFQYAESTIFLHRDERLMPARKAAWSAWNFLGEGSKGAVCLSYWLNALQNLGEVPCAAQGGKAAPVLVTLNPPEEPRFVHAKWTAAHPMPTVASAVAKRSLPEIQGQGGVFFAGAWGGFGFHEDGFKAGAAAAALVAGDAKWRPLANPPQFRIGYVDSVARASTLAFLRQFVKVGTLHIREVGGLSITIGGGQQQQQQAPPPVAAAPATAAEACSVPEAAPLSATLRVLRPGFYWKIATRADLGLADAFVDGDCELEPSLVAFLELVIANRDHAREEQRSAAEAAARASALIPQTVLGRARQAAAFYAARYSGVATAIVGLTGAYLKHLARSNTLAQARRNIAAHYDLSNDMFQLFLSPDMTYSCAIFERPDEPLQTAQERKLRRLAEKARVRPGDHVLEIGFGWSSLTLLLVKEFGARVTGITLSEQQLALATERVRAAGIADRVDFRLCDYRSLQPPDGRRFDRIVSCEMLEAVGHEYLPDYFFHCDRLLARDGVLVVQVITTPEERYEEYRRSTDFIKEYIFPGCCCPSLQAVVEAAGRTPLTLNHVEDIGPHYAPTLLRWRDAFLANKEALRKLGFNEQFVRCWDYYFCYCAAGFQTRTLGDLQLVFTRPGNVGSLGNVPYVPEPEK